VQFSGHGGEGNLGKGLGDADNGLELTDGNGDGGALVGLLLLPTDLRADRHKVVAQLVSRFRGQTRCALTVKFKKGKGRLSINNNDEARKVLRFAVGDVLLHDVNGDVAGGRLD